MRRLVTLTGLVTSLTCGYSMAESEVEPVEWNFPVASIHALSTPHQLEIPLPSPVGPLSPTFTVSFQTSTPGISKACEPRDTGAFCNEVSVDLCRYFLHYHRGWPLRLWAQQGLILTTWSYKLSQTLGFNPKKRRSRLRMGPPSWGQAPHSHSHP